MKKPLFVLVGADKGGVGKTTITRALLDFLAASKVQVRVFDSESPEGDLKRFFPQAEVIDISKVQDQMRVFDNMSTDVVTIVDIRAGLLSPTLKALDESGMLDDVRRGVVDFAILHVLGSSVASLTEIISIAKKLGQGAKHFLVKNNITDTGLGELADDARFASALAKAEGVTIEVPKLNDVACDKLQQLGGSYTDFARDTAADGQPSPNSRILRGYVKTWLNKVWNEFDRVGLSAIVGSRVVKSVA